VQALQGSIVSRLPLQSIPTLVSHREAILDVKKEFLQFILPCHTNADCQDSFRTRPRSHFLPLNSTRSDTATSRCRLPSSPALANAVVQWLPGLWNNKIKIITPLALSP
jgi:hypothetical protein